MNKTSNCLPEAYVSAGNNKNRLKIYNGKNVFLKNGEEFQIELFNPTSKTLGIKIIINGYTISNNMLILKPGQRYYLERYIDENKKFLFETYNVENSKEIKKAIEDNGNIKIEFYNEKIQYCNPFITTNTYLINTIPNYNTYLINTGTSYTNTGYTNTGTSCVGNISTTISDTSLTAGATTTGEIETGRIEKGNTSNQHFSNYFGEFESFSSYSIDYKLFPESTKPIEVEKLRQYCPNCRARIKKASHKFCFNCGEEL